MGKGVHAMRHGMRLSCEAPSNEPLEHQRARVAGVPIGAYCRSGPLMADAQYRAWQLYGQDAVVAQSDNYYIAEGFGVEVDHHEDSTPTLKTPVVHTLQDIERLRVPNPATLLHICGNMSPVLEDMAATGAHILELDHKVSLREARQRLGPGVCLMGNLDPVECLWRGAPAQVGAAAREAIAAAGGHGAFILGLPDPIRALPIPGRPRCGLRGPIPADFTLSRPTPSGMLPPHEKANSYSLLSQA